MYNIFILFPFLFLLNFFQQINNKKVTTNPLNVELLGYGFVGIKHETLGYRETFQPLIGPNGEILEDTRYFLIHFLQNHTISLVNLLLFFNFNNLKNRFDLGNELARDCLPPEIFGSPTIPRQEISKTVIKQISIINLF